MKQFILRYYFFIILGFRAIAAIILVNYVTPAGAGLANDSTAYIAGARSLLQGTGYSDIWLAAPFEPITHYPPLYSIFLYFGGLTGFDPLRGARALNMLLFGLNTVLIGVLTWQSTRQPLFAIWAAVMFELGAMFLRVHVYAMSEPLFIFFMVASLNILRLYFHFPKKLFIILLALFSGAAILTRYSGLALVPPFALAFLLFEKNWKQKLSSTMIYLGGTFLTVLPWFVRNSMVAGNVTNRHLQFHPITAENINIGVYNLSHHFIPIETLRQPIFKSGAWEWMLGAAFLTLCIVALVKFINLLRKPSDANKIFVFTLLAVFVIYFVSIFFSMSFFDNSTKLQDRILAPGLIELILFLAISSAFWLGKDRHWKMIGLSIFAVVTIYFSAVSVYSQAGMLREEGLGYANWKYRDNPVIERLQELPEDVTIYTNSPPAVYLTIERAVEVMPTSIDPVSNTERGGYSEKVRVMFDKIEKGEAVLAIFSANEFEDSSGYEPLEIELSGLTVLEKGGDAVLFSK